MPIQTALAEILATPASNGMIILIYAGGVMKDEGKKSALRIITEIVLMLIILLIASHYTM